MASSETVTITGGTGFLGSYIARAFVEDGVDVVVVDTSTDDTILEQLGVATDVDVREGDVTDASGLRDLFEATDTTRVVHLASLLTETARANPRAAIDVNVHGANNVFDAASQLDVERVTWASSLTVYAPPEKYDVESVSEDALVGPDTLYGATKVINETLSKRYREDHDVSVVGLRPTLVYGPYRQRGTERTDLIEKPARGEPYTLRYGEQLIDWLHVEDAAAAFVQATFASDADLSQHVYNVSGSTATISEAANLVRRLVPDADLTVTDEELYPWNFSVDRSSAEADLGYEPEYDLESGFRQYIETVRRTT